MCPGALGGEAPMSYSANPRQEGDIELQVPRLHSSAAPRPAALVEANGVVRDVVAAIHNLEHLLRSPRVGPRALANVIPDLKGLSDPLVDSVNQILAYLRVTAGAPVDAAALELSAYV